ncbi:MAG TPA: archaemetzincin [Steroidobacteraceae bacterium]|nr:archaemetzincin [Steroidobacteraceae bacterium]
MHSRRQLLGLAALTPALAWACAQADEIEDTMRRIRPLFTPKQPAQPGDWLAEHQEPGQSYRDFRKAVSRRAVDSFSHIRIVPIGPLSPGEQSVLDVTIDFMKPFFGLPLVVDSPVALDSIPEEAQREMFLDAPKQLLTTHLLNHVLMARRGPADAAVLGITALDLWPGPGWNYVFGQASLRERVGVWSMARNGEADGTAEMRSLCALRTAQTATHETGHMFGIRHCIAYQCGMNGSNHVEERDRQPLEFCAECQGKLWWTLGLDPLARSRALEATARRHGLERVAEAFARQSRALDD